MRLIESLYIAPVSFLHLPDLFLLGRHLLGKKRQRKSNRKYRKSQGAFHEVSLSGEREYNIVARWSRFSELEKPLDTSAHPWSIADSRVLRNELRSRIQQESHARRDAFDAVPHSLGTLGLQIA